MSNGKSLKFTKTKGYIHHSETGLVINDAKNKLVIGVFDQQNKEFIGQLTEKDVKNAIDLGLSYDVSIVKKKEKEEKKEKEKGKKDEEEDEEDEDDEDTLLTDQEDKEDDIEKNEKNENDTGKNDVGKKNEKSTETLEQLLERHKRELLEFLSSSDKQVSQALKLLLKTLVSES